MSSTVLLVESDADLRSAIAFALRRAEYDCDAVATGGDALVRTCAITNTPTSSSTSTPSPR